MGLMANGLLAVPPPQPVVEEGAIETPFLFLLGVLIPAIAGVVISLVVCALLHVIQSRVPAEHRTIEPALVWLLLIPLFNLIWNFFVFQRVPESYRLYFQSTGRKDLGDCGRKIGLWYAICAAASIVPCVNFVAGPAAVVLLVIFMVKLFGLRDQIPDSAPAPVSP